MSLVIGSILLKQKYDTEHKTIPSFASATMLSTPCQYECQDQDRYDAHIYTPYNALEMVIFQHQFFVMVSHPHQLSYSWKDK
jgi:hypothetical protein